MNEPLNEFEKAALLVALQGPAPWLQTLRNQVPHLRVRSRAYTAAGGYTQLGAEISLEKAFIPQEDSEYPPIAFIGHPMLTHGGAIVVWTKGGVIDLLEANADGDGKWPVGHEMHLEEFTFSKPLTPPRQHDQS